MATALWSRPSAGGPTPPSWGQSWAIANSTAIYACNYSGEFDLGFITQFALVALDWSHGKQVWANEHPMSSEQMLLREANRIKAARPSTNVMVYR